MATEQSSLNLLLCFFLICLFLHLPLAQTADHRQWKKTASMATSSPRRLLHPSTSTSTASMNPHPVQPSNSTSDQFKESKHEVPSGPNPVSNR